MAEAETVKAGTGVNYLAYDGDCPFCSRYVTWVTIQERHGPIDLIDTRQRPDLVAEFEKSGFDINRGMVLRFNGAQYYGDQAIHMIALLSSQSGLLSFVNRAVFSNHALAKLLYPVMVFGRNMTLRILNRPQI